MIATSDPTGSRTSDLINRYALYLSTVPIISSVTGVTSPMFAIEGLLLNGYAIHVARNFNKERTNANARKVFLTSLWYLPCLLSLFLLHSRKWHEEDDSTLNGFIHMVQDKGREMCLHEVVISNDVWVGTKEEKTALDKSKCPISMTRNVSLSENQKEPSN